MLLDSITVNLFSKDRDQKPNAEHCASQSNCENQIIVNILIAQSNKFTVNGSNFRAKREKKLHLGNVWPNVLSH